MPPKDDPKNVPQTGLRERRVEINREFESVDQLVSEYISNISHSGAFIRTRDPWPVGSRLRLKFTILAEDPEIFEAMAEVTRVGKNPNGMGVEFVNLSDSARALIEKAIAFAKKQRRRKSPRG